MNTCDVCGRPMLMEWNYGQIVFLCPARYDGLHPPMLVTYVSCNTGTLPSRRVPRDK